MVKASDYQHEPASPQPLQGPQVISAPHKLPITPSDILGPFYRPGALWTQQLAPDESVNLVLSGRVLTTSGDPAVGYIEFWQASAVGQYGSLFRGVQKIADDGSYQLRTVVPGFYDISDPGDPEPHRFRCPHIHVKVWVGGRDVLTTQLYFPHARYNSEDRWFDDRRVVKVAEPIETGKPLQAEFDIVIPQ